MPADDPTQDASQDTVSTPDPGEDPETPARTEPDPEREGEPDERAAANEPTGDDGVGA